jgi:hypothetical protein
VSQDRDRVVWHGHHDEVSTRPDCAEQLFQGDSGSDICGALRTRYIGKGLALGYLLGVGSELTMMRSNEARRGTSKPGSLVTTNFVAPNCAASSYIEKVSAPWYTIRLFDDSDIPSFWRNERTRRLLHNRALSRIEERNAFWRVRQVEKNKGIHAPKSSNSYNSNALSWPTIRSKENNEFRKHSGVPSTIPDKGGEHGQAAAEHRRRILELEAVGNGINEEFMHTNGRGISSCRDGAALHTGNKKHIKSGMGWNKRSAPLHRRCCK